MTMAGRKTAFPAEDLLAITREYIGLNEGRKIGYSDLSAYAAGCGKFKAAPTNRHFGRCDAVRILVDDHNARLNTTPSISPEYVNPADQTIDINRIVERCTTTAKVREVVTDLAGMADVYRSQNAKLADSREQYRYEMEKLRKENRALKEENASVTALRNTCDGLRTENKKLCDHLRTMRRFFNKIVLNEVSIRHLCDLNIIPLTDEERAFVMQTPASWLDLLTDETDIRAMLSGVPEYQTEQPVRGAAKASKQAETKDSAAHKSADVLNFDDLISTIRNF